MCVFTMALLDTCKITKRYLTIPFEPTIPLSRKHYIMIATQSTSVSGAGIGSVAGAAGWAGGPVVMVTRVWPVGIEVVMVVVELVEVVVVEVAAVAAVAAVVVERKSL